MYSYIYHPISRKKFSIHSRKGLNILKNIVNAQTGGVTVKELKVELKTLGLPTSGRKAELIARLAGTSISSTSVVKKSKENQTNQKSKKSKKKSKTGINLADHSTFLADINELSTAKHLSELLGLSFGEIEQEINNKETERLRIVSTLNVDDQKRFNSAVSIKRDQGKQVAIVLLRDNHLKNRANIKEIVWSNTPERFKNATGEKLHADNPSDIVIIYTKSVNIYGENRTWYGVSLKSSFSSGDIGQYNSSSCKFIAGILFSQKNEDLKALCKSSSLNIYTRFQNEINRVYKDFQDGWCTDKISGWSSASTGKLKKNAWKNALKGKNTRLINESKIARCNMYSQCVDLFYNYLKSIPSSTETGSDSTQISISLSLRDAKTALASYLRIDSGKIDSRPNYLKALATPSKVFIKFPGVYNYINPDTTGPINFLFTKVGSGTLNLSCGGKESINFRVKLASVPPAAIKINGQNNPNVMSIPIGGNFSSILQKGGDGNIKTELFALITEAIANKIEHDNEYDEENEEENLIKFLNMDTPDIIEAIENYKDLLQNYDQVKARHSRWIIRQIDYYSDSDILLEVIEQIKSQQDFIKALNN